MAWASPIHAEKVVTQPKAGSPGQWRLIGTTEANHSADHDAIIVKGPFDNFRRLKFKVTDAPLNMQHMVVTYDNGAPDRIEVRQNIAQGGRAGRSTFEVSVNAASAKSSSGTTQRDS
jgi:hypothetical protein